MTARLIKTATSWKIPHEKDRFSPLQHFRDYVGSMKGWFHWSIAVTWCVTWKLQKSWREEMEQFVWFRSNVTRMGEEDTTKRKKVTITCRKKNLKETKQKIRTNKRNKRKQRSFLSVYFSLGYAVVSRIIQSQEPKRLGEKSTRKNKKREDLPSFPLCTLSKTRSGPHNLNSALLFLVLCSETARKRLLHWLRRPSKNRLDPG